MRLSLYEYATALPPSPVIFKTGGGGRRALQSAAVICHALLVGLVMRLLLDPTARLPPVGAGNEHAGFGGDAAHTATRSATPVACKQPGTASSYKVSSARVCEARACVDRPAGHSARGTPASRLSS